MVTNQFDAPGEQPAQDTRSGKLHLLARLESILAILLSGTVLFLLIVRMTHAGALDRDECDALNLARMPHWSDIRENLQYTAFPILFPATVRTYTHLFGTSDFTLRLFGLVAGGLMLIVAWFYSRSVTRQVPLLLPALIGLNINFLTTGSWLRGYGLGSLMTVLAFVLTAKLLLQPSLRRLTGVFFAYLAAMQLLFFNGALVPAIALGAIVVLLENQKLNWVWLLAAATTVCAIVYVPYLVVIFSSVSKWAMLVQFPLSAGTMLGQWVDACGGSHLSVSVSWLTVVLLALIGACWRLRTVWGKGESQERSMLLFGVTGVVLCASAYFAFLRVAHNRLQERHYLDLMCLIAVATDLIVATLCWNYRIRLARLIIVIVAILTLPAVAWPRVVERQTNIDTIAARLAQDAHPNDLIIVSPWWLGISFGHYYQGPNRWMTVPEITNHRLHRYDLIKAKMTEFFPLSDVESAVEDALKSGHRVWIVGRLGLEEHGPPPVLAPAPDPQYGWSNYAYTKAWWTQIGFLVRHHAERIEPVEEVKHSVREWENFPLLIAEGWRY